MTRRFTRILAALALLACLAIPLGLQADEAQYVFNTDAGIAALGIDKPTVGAGTSLSTTTPYTVGQISMSVTHGSTDTRVWNSSGTLDLRIYKSGGSLTFAAASGYNITGVTITGSKTGNFSVNVGTYSSGSWSNGTTGASSVTFTATNTGQINTITVTYSASGGLSLEDSDLALVDAPVELEFDLYDNANPQTISYTTSSTGAVTVSQSNYITATVNANNTITVTPVAVTNGTQTITVNQAADNTYAAGSVTFTVDIEDSTPSTGTDVTFDATEDLGNSTAGEGSITKNGVLFHCSNGILGNGTEYRLYKNSTTTFSVTSGTITKIVFTCKSGNPASGFGQMDGLTFSGNNGTWTGSATSISFVASVKQVQATLIVVTVEGASAVTAPTFSPADGATIINGDIVMLECDTPDASIYYTMGNNPADPTNESTPYNSDEGIEVTQSTTIKAIAYVGDEHSSVATASYTVLTPLTTMDAIYSAATTANDTPATVAITFNNWIVTGVGLSSNIYKRAFVTDGTKGFIIYNNNESLTFQRGDVLSGSKVCQVKLLNGAPCVMGLNASDFNITQTGAVPTETSTTIDALSAVNTGAVVDLGILTWNGSYFVDDNDNGIHYYNTIYSGDSFETNKTYSVKGVFVYYSGGSNGIAKEIAPRDAEDIVEVVITDPYITIESDAFELTANEEEGYLEITYGNFTPISFDIMYCDANGNELSDYPGWITLAIETPAGEEGDFVYYDVEPNGGAARTAYFKVYASLGENQGEVYSNIVTVTQAAPVVDYAFLPFIWAGGTKEELTALNGVTGFGLGSNYAETNAPYRVKFDNQGDYILVKTDSQPGKVTIGIKNFGSSTGTIIAVQESSNGSDFTEVEELTITCSQNKTQEFETSNSFNASSRYVRLYDKTHNSNFGVGPITIAKPIQKTLIANQWYLISSPVGTIDINNASASNVITSGTYGLYSFDQTGGNDGKEWRNYKAEAFSQLEAGTGYLYINQAGCTLTFTGTPYDGDGSFQLVYSNSTNITESFRGLNLVGNPYAQSATIDHDYYIMNADGTDLAPYTSEVIVPAMQGVFVKATEEGQYVTFTPNQSTTGGKGIEINLSQNRGTIVDRAIVRFGEGSQLAKVQLFDNSTKLYIPQNGKDYAIVSAEGQGELPVNFRASENGTYTLSIDAEDMDMNYLHLIDNMTGMDVDLLQTPSYTFEATTRDYESRFRLVFAGASTGSATDDSFAFYSNGNLIINYEDNATLQVIDLTGRILSSETISGSCSTSINAPTGVYMLRLINGDNVKVQKIVVR